MQVRYHKLLSVSNYYLIAILFFVFALMSTSCDGSTGSVIQTAIAETKSSEPIATIQSTYTPFPTYTLYPTYTPNIVVVTATNSPTPLFTLTPSFTPTITFTPTATVPPTNTPTFTPTVTQTKEPGIGVDIKCGDEFIVNVLKAPRREPYFYGQKANGEFWLFEVQITNLMSETHDFNDSDFGITGSVNGQGVTFSTNWDATFDWVWHNYGRLYGPYDELGPTLSTTLGIAFEVNPIAENPRFEWAPKENMFDNYSLCRVSIPIQ